VLARALDESPEARYPGALAFAAAFEAASRGERPTAASEQGRVLSEPAAAATAAEADLAAAAPADAPHDLSVDVDEGQGALAFEPEFQRAAEEVDDTQIEREADLEDIQLRQQEALDRGQEAFDEEAAREPERAPAPVEIEAAEPKESYLPPEPPLAFEPESVAPEVREPGLPMQRLERLDHLEHLERIEPHRPVLFLPVAVTLLLGLFVGFLAGYLVGSREVDTTGQGAQIGGQSPQAGGQEAEAGGQRPGAGGQGTEAGGQGTESTRGRDVPPSAASPGAGTTPLRPAAPATRATGPAAPPARAATPGRLVVRSTPPGALVYLNGRRRGSTPVAIRGLAPGTYTVRVARSGYRDQTQRISVSASGSRDVSFRLQRPPAPAAPASTGTFTGSIYVDSRPRGARVLLDGRAVGTTPVQLGDVSAGTHVVRIELDEHRPWTTSARVVSGQVIRVAASLERQP
jgi:PEGA domain